MKLLFAGERKVCDQIFEGFDSLTDQCFADVTTGSVAVLLSFGDAIAKSKRSPEKLFVLLDMYEIMRELHSEVWKKCVKRCFLGQNRYCIVENHIYASNLELLEFYSQFFRRSDQEHCCDYMCEIMRDSFRGMKKLCSEVFPGARWILHCGNSFLFPEFRSA